MSNSEQPSGYPITDQGRMLLGLWSLFLLTGFSVALALDPNPRGYGTHQALGLPPCTFRLLFGIPCPNCGMTTSFSHFVRGQFAQSCQVNFAGFVLAVTCVVQIPWCWWSMYQKRLWRIGRPEFAVFCLLVALFSVTLVTWGYRLSSVNAD